MKNKLSDLNNHLFAQMERLSDEDLSAEKIEQEVQRAKAIVGISDQIIGAAALQFKAAELVAEHGRGVANLIPESMVTRTIEHKPAALKIAKPQTDEERELAEAEERRRERARSEEQQERARQEQEGEAA
tara:strand:+ start:6581 stop:6970 length:390 start_codon:yes stop_codon:yes gene_type:complete